MISNKKLDSTQKLIIEDYLSKHHTLNEIKYDMQDFAKSIGVSLHNRVYLNMYLTAICNHYNDKLDPLEETVCIADRNYGKKFADYIASLPYGAIQELRGNFYYTIFGNDPEPYPDIKYLIKECEAFLAYRNTLKGGY